MPTNSELFTCALCGKDLRRERDLRYEVKVEIKAAYDPLRISAEDLETDFRTEIGKLLRQLEGLSADDAQDQIYRVYQFNLCSACRPKFVAELAKVQAGAAGDAGLLLDR